MEGLKRELKKIGNLALFFFICFAYILVIMKLFLKEYSINSYVLSKAIIGSLFAAKAVAILDTTPWINKFASSRRYLNVLYKTFIYTCAVLLLGVIENLIHAYHETKSLSLAISKFIHTENFYHFLATILCISVVLLIHNILEEIDHYLGKGNLKKIFFERPHISLKK